MPVAREKFIRTENIELSASTWHERENKRGSVFGTRSVEGLVRLPSSTDGVPYCGLVRRLTAIRDLVNSA